MKILFVCHEATLTGAPLVLLNFLKWLKKEKPEVVSKMILLEKGERYVDFKNHVNEIWLKPIFNKKYSKWFYLYKALLLKFNKKIYTEWENYENKLKAFDPEFIYCNTILSITEGIYLKGALPNAKLIAHIHELPIAIDVNLPGFKENIPFFDKFIAVSHLVKKSMLETYSISENKIKVVHEFVEPITLKIPQVKKQKTYFKVGAAGTVHWRKGYDFFILVAKAFINKYPSIKIKFEWVGKLDLLHENIVKADLDKLELNDVVEFSGLTSEPISKFSDFDIFLMTSREDPFPLVCLEVAQLGKPIICFDKGTGTVEFVKQGGGVVVPYMDIECVILEIYKYINNQAAYQRDSKESQLLSKEFVSNIKAPEIYNMLNSL